MAKIAQNLQRLERALSGLGRVRALEAMGTPQSASDVQRRLRSTGVDQIKDLEDLYGWRDGIRDTNFTIGEISLFPGFFLVSIEDLVRHRQANLGRPGWLNTWLPFLENGGGDYYVLDTTDGSIRHFRYDDLDHPVEFASMDALWATIADAYEQGAIVVSDEGFLEFKCEQFDLLAAQRNPGVAWWTIQ